MNIDLTFKFFKSLLFALTFIFGQQLLAQEICDNRIDDDGDGLIDCLDPDCANANTCWECLTEFYQVHSNTTLVKLDPFTGAYQTIATISGASEINGAQFNPIDGHVYAPVKINGIHKLGVLSQDGSVTDTGLSLPGNGIFYVGAISASGIMYISNATGIHSIDLNAPTLQVVNTGLPHAGVADLALDLNNGLFYGITGGAKLKVFNPFDMTLSNYDLAGSINNDPGGFGAAWSSNDGSFFAYNNSSGKIYTIDINNLTATLVLNGTGNLSINDGFNCVLAPPPFETKCGDGIDNDGDGLIDCMDQDCYTSNECTVEICDNGIDDDNDGWTDCSDSECYDLIFCIEICDNGIDDNGNGLIDSEDPQCGTSSGGLGGLESNRRLSDKIALRNFETRVKNNDAFYQKIEGVIPFIANQNRTNFEIASFIPTEILNAYVAESTPLDLIAITNAVDVAAADYYVNDQRIGSVLGLFSEDGVYEHTKYICDRLEGARLLDISYLYAKGGNFISYELLNKNGQKEYAVSFAARLNNQNQFLVENHWNLHKYKAGEDYYNFQIWANNYNDLITLLEDILNTMESKSSIVSIEHSAIPRVFVMEGNYKNGSIQLRIRNKNFSPVMNFKAKLTRAEGSVLEDYNVDIDLSGASEESIIIETGHLYDLGASITSEGSPDDEIFFADGSWGVDLNNPNASVHSFDVSQETNDHSEEVFQVERSISLSASVKDYLNVYRSLDAKLNKKDLSKFNSLVFNNYGNGALEITIVKESIEAWENQYRTVIELTEQDKMTTLFIEDFESNSEDNIDLSDVTMIVFTLLGDNQAFAERELNLSNVRFQNSVTTSTTDHFSNSNLSIFPNPVQSLARISFDSEIRSIYEIQISNALGQIISQETLRVMNGTNSYEINTAGYSVGTYTITISNEKEILHVEKFVKMP